LLTKFAVIILSLSYPAVLVIWVRLPLNEFKTPVLFSHGLHTTPVLAILEKILLSQNFVYLEQQEE